MHLSLLLNTTMRLTEENFIMFAMKEYQNPNCVDIDDFNDDLKRIKYIKRLFNRYHKSPETFKVRLLRNHIIVLYNVFGPYAATKILFFKTDPKFWPALKTFLIYLNYMPDIVEGIGDRNIISSDIPLDLNIVKILRADDVRNT